MVYIGIHWYTLVYIGIHWYTLVYIGIHTFIPYLDIHSNRDTINMVRVNRIKVSCFNRVYYLHMYQHISIILYLILDNIIYIEDYSYIKYYSYLYKNFYFDYNTFNRKIYEYTVTFLFVNFQVEEPSFLLFYILILSLFRFVSKYIIMIYNILYKS